ncbi:ROK family protein [Aquamicrobium segne]|uniref:ROK family protein n=1 Tax=Aquamicrobium segne TaxID=469547 RepID=A0ABW0GUI2_9HYPH
MESGTDKHALTETVDPRLHRGANQSGMRDHNERLVLSLVRLHGSLSKSDITRRTGLSAQTISVIMRELERDGLLLKQAPKRGRIGQPSVPMSLNPDGAFFIGLKIGRRSCDLLLIDFLGSTRASLRLSYRYPVFCDTVEFVSNGLTKLCASLSPAQQKRIAGLGIAMPFRLWEWAQKTAAPDKTVTEHQPPDIRAAIQPLCDYPVFLQNDATAACGAELVFGQTGMLRDFVYFYIGALAGGGIVLGGRLYTGPTGNAGALGSMPVPGKNGQPAQLLDIASIAVLEKRLNAQGIKAPHLWTTPEDWGDLGPIVDEWIKDAASALAHAIISSASVIDFEAAIIDGWMPVSVRERLFEALCEAIGKIDTDDLCVPHVRQGTIGIHARALGAASLPLSERFLIGPALAAGST